MRARATRIAVLLALLLTSGCASTSLKDALHPHFLGGKDAEAWIDRRVGNMLAVYHPGLAIGRAHCPFLLNLTGPHSHARCTLPVEQATLRIDVVSDYGSDEKLRDVDSLVVERDAEHDLVANLARAYTEPYTVHCDGDPIRVVPARESVECTATGPDGLRKTLQAWPRGYTGGLSGSSLAGAETVAEHTLGRDAVERRHGDLTLNGRDVERLLAATVGGTEREDLVRRGLLRAPHCPPRVSLRGSAHVFCFVPVGATTLRYDLRFDQGRGLQVEAPGSVFAVAALNELGARYFERSMRNDGAPQKAVVDCGHAQVVVLVEPGDDVHCVLQTFRAKRAVSITMESYGEFRFDEADDEKDAATTPR
jgi:hypothetical protein